MTKRDPDRESDVDLDKIREFAETNLPPGTSLEDAIRAFMEVDPERVKEAEKADRDEAE